MCVRVSGENPILAQHLEENKNLDQLKNDAGRESDWFLCKKMYWFSWCYFSRFRRGVLVYWPSQPKINKKNIGIKEASKKISNRLATYFGFSNKSKTVLRKAGGEQHSWKP